MSQFPCAAALKRKMTSSWSLVGYRWWSCGTIPCIFNLETRRIEAVKCTTRRLNVCPCKLPQCSLDKWPAGWTPERVWKIAHFRESNPNFPVVKTVVRSLCRLKYSGYFCLKHKLHLTADMPFCFRPFF